jgi:hypothetical protein
MTALRRIRVTLQVDVDLDRYRDEYSEHGATTRDLRDYVEGAAHAAVTDALRTIDARVRVPERSSR